MIREIVTIDEERCNGCGECVPACHEGALQIIDGKARLVSDLMCDGLGACLGNCPMDAISIEKREAEPYDEVKVMEIMVTKGENTVIAHLKHLKDHNETEFLKQAVRFLNENAQKLTMDIKKIIHEVHHSGAHDHHAGGSCPGSAPRTFQPQSVVAAAPVGQTISGQSELRQWPVQMHLINPNASYFQQADVVIAADCVAFSLGDFHQKWLKGKSVAIACPKLDSGLDSYQSKIKSMIDEARVNTLTVMMMQVPCCGGLLQLVKNASAQASRKVPIKAVIVGIEGEILQEEWV